MISLFQHYPRLTNKLPHVSLGDFPTPLHRLDRLGSRLGVGSLYIKRDDLSGLRYGGNKVRKLEFLLGEALARGAKEVLTFGYAGSNHALATAIYANTLGLKCICMLLPQPNAGYVRRNLLLAHSSAAELHQHRNELALAAATVYQLICHKQKVGRFPHLIVPGGSSPFGTIGYVSATFELFDQVQEGNLPEPERIYVALGTSGTAAGILLGIKALQWKTQLIAVRVAEKRYASTRKMKRLFSQTNSLLRSLDPNFPSLPLHDTDFQVRHEYFGSRYGLFTESGIKSVAEMQAYEQIRLEGTYTGKTFAAVLDDLTKPELKDQVILFWNTHNSRAFPEAALALDYHELPKSFHRYFETDTQPLDLVSSM